MRVLVTNSTHYVQTPDGVLWTANAASRYAIWTRYLEVFSQVDLLVRTRACTDPPSGWVPASGEQVRALPLPDFVGISWQFVRSYRAFGRRVAEAIAQAEAIVLHLPCPVASAVWRSLPPSRPYGIEVIADPYDVFQPGSFQHPLRPALQWWFTRELRQQCRQAPAASYVTQAALQKRYPCPHHAVGISDVNLPDDGFVAGPRHFATLPQPLRLIFVGSLAQLYKAPDILIRAFAISVQAGLDLNLTLVGDGKYRSQLEELATTLGVAPRLCFRGQLANREAVQAALDEADLFVLPSYMEGLPRAMVEAMARALPCIGSTAGGIPELLAADCLVPPGDAIALATKIQAVSRQPERLTQMSVENWQTAQQYRQTILQGERQKFYTHIQKMTAPYLAMS